MNVSGSRPRVHVSETVEAFSENWPNTFKKLLDSLRVQSLWRDLLRIAVDRNILKLRSDQRLESFNDCESFFFELMRVQCTLKHLIDCLDGEEFDDAKSILGIFTKMQVVRQPCAEGLPLLVRKGDSSSFEFVVSGFPYPTYQWFHCDEPIDGACYNSYCIENFSDCNEGTYWCRATQSARRGRHILCSTKFECRLVELVPSFQNPLVERRFIPEGHTLTLSVKANEEYSGAYEWMFNNQIIPDAASSCLVIDLVRKEEEGEYRCLIKNRGGECSCKFIVEVQRVQRFPRLKIAILIGNSNYDNLKALKTPPNDVQLLERTLTSIGFHVIQRINRTRDEMVSDLNELSSIIIPDSFVLFFFTGHGFELRKNKFFIPVDCPPSGKFRMSDCVSEEFLLESFIRCQPKLLVTIFDMCLKIPNREDNPLIFEERLPCHSYDSSPSRLVQACSTTDYQESFENRKELTSLYCRCLCQFLDRELPVKECFENAHELFALNSGKQQKPLLSSNDDQRYCLITPALLHPETCS